MWEGNDLNKKLTRLIEPNIQPAIICLSLFVVLAIPFQPVLALAEAALTLILYIFMQHAAK